jgi:PD-(D/E)XK nuclease superfamily
MTAIIRAPEATPLELTRTVRDISVTERMAFRTCRRQWYLTTIENLEPRGAINWPFEFGTGLHSGLEAFYRAVGDLDEGDPLDNAILAFNGWYEAVDAKIKKDLGDLAAPLRNELMEFHDLGIGMLENYNEFAIDADDFYVVAVEGVLTEKGKELLGGDFRPPYSKGAHPVRHTSGRILVPIVNPNTHKRISSFKVGGEPVYLSSRLDLIVFRRSMGLRGFWIYDHKSTGSSPSERGLDFDDQVTGYDYSFWRLTGAIPRGTVFNYLVKQLPKEPRIVSTGLSYAKDQLTLPNLYREALVEYGLMQNGRVTSDRHAACYAALLAHGWKRFFRRFEVERNEHELQMFEHRLIEEYTDMLDAYKFPATRAYPNLSQYICPGCPVDRICQAIEDGSDYEFIQDELFQQQEDRKA